MVKHLFSCFLIDLIIDRTTKFSIVIRACNAIEGMNTVGLCLEVVIKARHRGLHLVLVWLKVLKVRLDRLIIHGSACHLLVLTVDVIVVVLSLLLTSFTLGDEFIEHLARLASL